MKLTAKDIAKMIDISCVRTTSNQADIEEIVAAAMKYGFGQVSINQCFIPYTKQLLKNAHDIHLVGNVSFPSGSDSTSVKVFQAKEMVATGCDELDVVINVGKLKSGSLAEVEEDLREVIQAAKPLPVKVIIEIMYLSREETKQACEISIRCGAKFVKTGTGWADRGTTIEDVKLVKSLVGDKALIKASGGIRDLHGLLDLYEAGARRFGVNLKSGISIVEEALAMHDGIEV